MRNGPASPINQLLYGLTYSTDITDDLVDFFARSAIHHETLGLGPEAYYSAIKSALASGEDLAVAEMPQFDHTAIAGFLRAVAARLDSLRPWVEPRFVRPNPAGWQQFEESAPIALLDMALNDARDLLRERFDPVSESEGTYALILDLDGIETIALVGSYRTDGQLTLFTQKVEDSAGTIHHCLSATGFPADKVHPI